MAGLPEALRGLRLGVMTDIHRSQTVSHEMVDRRRRPADGGAARPDPARRRLRLAGGDQRYVQPAADALGAAVGAARRDRDPRQSRRRAGDAGRAGGEGLHRAEGRAHAADHPRRGDGLRGDPLLDLQGRATSRTSCAAPSRTTFLLAHTPKRLLEAQQLAVPAVISGHTHGGQIVLPGIGAIAAREFPVVAGLGAAAGHDDLRQPRRRHRLRAGPHQLPARGGGADAGAGDAARERARVRALPLRVRAGAGEASSPRRWSDARRSSRCSCARDGRWRADRGSAATFYWFAQEALISGCGTAGTGTAKSPSAITPSTSTSPT